jgi:hypothetical protein
MPDLHTALQANQSAVAEFLETARQVSPDKWLVPRAEGKWSPAQVTEHLAKAYEESQKLIAGTSAIRPFPKVLRPLVGAAVRWTILRTGRFPKGRAPAPFLPSASPPAQDILCARLQEASDVFERSAENAHRAGQTTFDHPFFGKFGVGEYAQLQAYHSVHHRSQLGLKNR